MKYAPELASQVCELVAGGMSLVGVCRMDGMPAYRTVMDWLAKHDDFAHRYARAREEQADTLADQLLDIADDQPPLDPNGKTDAAWVSWQKNRIDTRKWIAAKLKPKKYGDRVGVEIDVSDTLAERLKAARERSGR